MKERVRVLEWCYFYSDAFSVVSAWFIAYLVRFYGPFPVDRGIPNWIDYVKLVPFLLAIWCLVFVYGGMYSSLNGKKNEIIEVTKYSVIMLVIFVCVAFFYREYRYSRLTLAIFAVVHPCLSISLRSGIRRILHRQTGNKGERRLLLIGDARHLHLATLVSSLNDFVPPKFTVFMPLGPLDDEQRLDLKDKDVAVHAIPESWDRYLSESPIDGVVVAAPLEEIQRTGDHLAALSSRVLDIRVIPDLSAFQKLAAGIDIVDNVPVIHLNDSPLKGSGFVKKRVFDLFGALVGIVLFSPLFALIAALIKLTSKGPIFYHQERMGLDGKIFSILKFRTMTIDAESKSGATWARKGDSRTTKIGGLLRRTSLDEIPQFFNVVKGEMSLVGPRPERPIFVNKFRDSVPGYMLRHKVKAGITGWAQVSGWRGNTSIEKRIECDLFYIKKWSLSFDIKIICLTLLKGFIHPNAY